MAKGRNSARRRRVILDEMVQQTGLSATTINAEKTVSGPGFDLANSYSDAAKRRGQLKTTDLIPKRPLPLGIVIGVVISIYIGINLLDYYSKAWSALSDAASQVLGISGVGTISAWYSSLLLLVSGMASLQIYGMRKHRCNDYRGHYRVWLFLAALFILASANFVIDFKSVLQSLSHSFGLAGGNSFIVMLVAKVVALTALVVRGVLEIRASKAAMVSVVIVWVAYASAIVSQIPGVQQNMVQREELVFGNLVLVGTIALFLTVIFYARFVYLHANELIKLSPIDLEEDARPVKPVNADSKETRQTGDSQSATASEPSDEILKLNVTPEGKKSSKKLSRKARKQQRKAA